MAKKFRHFLSSAGPAGRPSWWQLITKKRMEQHKTRSFLLGRGKKKKLPEIIYVTFTLSYVLEQQTELLQGAIQIKHSGKTMTSQHISKQY